MPYSAALADWLPVRYRITYKLCTLMHNMHVWKSPRYLADIVGGVSLGAVEAECVLSIGAVSGRRCLRRRS